MNESLALEFDTTE